MKKIVYIIITLCIIPTFYAEAYTFNNKLSLGNTNNDVLELQKILNLNTETQVSLEGPGSPGNETNYFGQKTKEAVIAFQNLHSEEILKPSNLISGTGFVGQNTLNFLNSISSNNSQNVTNSNNVLNETNNPDIVIDPNGMSAQFFSSKKVAKIGDKIYIGSQNDISQIDFFIGSDKLDKKCYTNFSCELILNKKIKTGLQILNTSDVALGEENITILDSSIKNPKINTKSLSLSKENIIKGDYFSEKMTVYTMLGVFTTETKDNSFILEFPSNNFSTSTFNGLFYVENDNGLTSDILNIKYEI